MWGESNNNCPQLQLSGHDLTIFMHTYIIQWNQDL